MNVIRCEQCGVTLYDGGCACLEPHVNLLALLNTQAAEVASQAEEIERLKDMVKRYESGYLTSPVMRDAEVWAYPGGGTGRALMTDYEAAIVAEIRREIEADDDQGGE